MNTVETAIEGENGRPLRWTARIGNSLLRVAAGLSLFNLLIPLGVGKLIFDGLTAGCGASAEFIGGLVAFSGLTALGLYVIGSCLGGKSTKMIRASLILIAFEIVGAVVLTPVAC